MRPFSGFLIDHFPRKTLYVISFAFFALLSFTCLSASSESTFLTVRILHGLIWGVITTAGNTLALGPMTGILLSESRPFSQIFTVAVVSRVLGYGMNFPAVQTIIINHGDHHQRGTANSTFFTAFDIGVGIGIVLGGQIAQYSDLSMALLGTGISGLTQGKEYLGTHPIANLNLIPFSGPPILFH